MVGLSTPLKMLLTHRRTVAEIKSKVLKRSKKNAISRALNSKKDGLSIATWKTDLDRILLIFNVRPVIFVWPALTVSFRPNLG